MSGSDNIKAVFNPEEGHTDNYFGGANPEGDGSGHGHVRVTTEGETTIVRGSYSPGVPFARQDATVLDSRNFDDRGYYNS